MENKVSALSRITSLLNGRGLNPESVSVAAAEGEGITRMIFSAEGDPAVIEQVLKQVNNLVDVIQVLDYSPSDVVVREMALIKIRQRKNNLSDLANAVALLNGRIIEVCNKMITVELTGTPENIQSAVNLLNDYGIKEVARSGCIAVKTENSSINK